METGVGGSSEERMIDLDGKSENTLLLLTLEREKGEKNNPGMGNNKKAQ